MTTEFNLSEKIEDVYTDYTSILTLKVEDVKEAVKLLKENLSYDDEEDRFFLNRIDKIFGDKLI